MPRKRIRKFGSPTHYVAETWARERPDLNPSDYLFLMHVLRLGRVIDRLDDRYCRQRFGISGADMRVLFALRRGQRDDAPRPADLAHAQIVTTGAMTKQLDRLEALNLVKRRQDASIGGSVLVTATKKGVALADLAITEMIEKSPLSAKRSRLSRAERDQIAKLCAKLLLELEEK